MVSIKNVIPEPKKLPQENRVDTFFLEELIFFTPS
jgi:hypothetical protein